MDLPEDHQCAWRDEAEKLRADLADVHAQLEAIKRRVFGKSCEKVTPVDREVRRERPVDPAETRAERRARAVSKERLETERIEVPVPAEQRACGKCGRDRQKLSSKGKPSTVIDYVPGYFRRRVYEREVLSCGACRNSIVTAPAVSKIAEKTRYSEGFLAHLLVSKCGDSIPLYRLEKSYKRLGIPIARSTMTDLFHRAAETLAPLADLLMRRIAASEIVLADETPIRLQHQDKKAYMWTFLSGAFIGYRFSTDRSGETPSQVLGETTGMLVVDAYTGYNPVTSLARRVRIGCLAHARRKFFDALPTAPEAAFAISQIREVYVVEHDARKLRIARTEAHAVLRQGRSREAMNKLHEWLVEQKALHLPKGPMGRAISYALEQWVPLTRFLDDVRLPPDNNRSEAALRVVTLGRKNFLFVGSEDAGANIAGVYSLIATCEAHRVNPLGYLRDVLLRVQDHPNHRLDELLPDRWQPLAAAANVSPVAYDAAV